MATIDVQVHCYERDHPGRPWHSVLAGPPEVTGADMIKAMDEVGVDGALLISVFAMYRFDASYAVSVHKQFPDRFALIKPVNPNDPKVGEVIEEWAKMDGTVAVRIMMNSDVSTDPADPGINKVLSTAGRDGLPVNLMCRGRLPQVAELAKRNPGTTLVVDHLGLEQPFHPPAPKEPWVELPLLLSLAAQPNIVVKISGACTLSHEPFPYKDIRAPIDRIIGTFGLDRCMWGTDWTRAVNLLTYREGVDAFRAKDWLSDSDRATLMGGTLTKVYGWAPKKA
ncbi:amidohydrolase family protein [Reyranella sp.]|uniref:amidohydrolase family protein n=1 Tax=Reyranella sp. TaxID=1929291 RepID=UPI003BACA01A